MTQLVIDRKRLRPTLARVFDVGGSDASAASLSRLAELDKGTLPVLAPVLVPTVRKSGKLSKRMGSFEPETFELDQVEGSRSNIPRTLDVRTVGKLAVTLPFGSKRRFVNAITFKALAGRPKDTLLKQSGTRWEIVGNEELIDLANKSVVYKLGPIQVYS